MAKISATSLAAACIFSIILLSACGGGSKSEALDSAPVNPGLPASAPVNPSLPASVPANEFKLSGTAATGAPVANETLSVKCAASA